MLDRTDKYVVLFVIALGLSALGGVGCEPVKKADAAISLALSFNVDTVDYAGRQHIRLHSRRALVVIDPLGGAVVDYHRHDRTGALYRPPADETDGDALSDAERDARIARLYNAQPNVLDDAAWRTATDQPSEPLDRSRCWVVDSGLIHIVLLSDTVEGLRWRRTYRLDDNGVLDVHVQLHNRSGAARIVTADSHFAGETPRPADVVDTAARTEHRRIGGQWLSRRLLDGPPSLVHADRRLFRFAGIRIDDGAMLRWTERWWITPATGAHEAAAPADPPPFRRKPNAADL